MDFITAQRRVRRNNKAYGFTDDLPTLGLGLCEEAGEVAKAINLHNPLYIQRKPHVNDEGNIEHEILDVLVYTLSIANALDMDLDKLMEQKLLQRSN